MAATSSTAGAAWASFAGSASLASASVGTSGEDGCAGCASGEDGCAGCASHHGTLRSDAALLPPDPAPVTADGLPLTLSHALALCPLTAPHHGL
eukprot:Skav234340  [mRNA]  locus=scaffold306:596063:612190:- [translate_table: standard]